MEIAGYIRVSGSHQAKLGGSLPYQRKTIEKYALEQGHTIYRIYSDEGISGARAKRPGLDAMKRDGENHLFQRIVFTSLDRFGRSVIDTLGNYKYFESLGINICSIKEGIDTSTPIGRLFRTILAAVAEMSREWIRERCDVGLLRRLENGLTIGGVLPYGYTWKKASGEIEVVKDQANVYKRIVRAYLVEKKSMTRIAFELNQESIPSRRGKDWRMSGVRLLLTNPAYKGRYCYNRFGKRYHFMCPPLIRASQWDRIQYRISRIKEELIGQRRVLEIDAYLLRGMLKCGECGHAIHPNNIKSRGTLWRYYFCYVTSKNRGYKRNYYRVKKCPLPGIPAVDIEAVILLSIKRKLENPVNALYLWPIEELLISKVALQERWTKHRLKLGHLEEKINQSWRMFNDDMIGKQELLKTLNSLRKPVRVLKRAIENSEKEIEVIQARENALKELHESKIRKRDTGVEIQKALQKMTIPEIKGLLTAAIGKERLSVSILRRGDILTEKEGLNSWDMKKPILDEDRIKPHYAWKVEGIHDLNFTAAAQYLLPFLDGLPSRRSAH